MGAGLTVLVVAVVVVAVASLWRRRTDGRVRVAPAGSDAVSAEELGGALGPRATLVQFSSSTCATCPPTAALLSAMAHARPGVVHVDVDAEQRMDLVRRLRVLRTPTVLVLGPDGQVRGRTVGAPRRAELEDLLLALGAGG